MDEKNLLIRARISNLFFRHEAGMSHDDLRLQSSRRIMRSFAFDTIEEILPQKRKLLFRIHGEQRAWKIKLRENIFFPGWAWLIWKFRSSIPAEIFQQAISLKNSLPVYVRAYLPDGEEKYFDTGFILSHAEGIWFFPRSQPEGVPVKTEAMTLNRPLLPASFPIHREPDPAVLPLEQLAKALLEAEMFIQLDDLNKETGGCRLIASGEDSFTGEYHDMEVRVNKSMV